MVVVAVSVTGAWAQDSGVAVLVMADDEDRASVKRSSAIFERVMGVLREGLRKQGFRMIDEESVAAGTSWVVRDRQSRSALVEMAVVSQRGGTTRYSARVLVLVRVLASASLRGPVARVRLRMQGDVFDVSIKQFLGSLEAPAMELAASAGCVRDRACLQDFVAEHAETAAGDLSRVVAEKLSLHLGMLPGGQPPTSAPGEPRRSAAGQPVPIPYTVTLWNFERREALLIVGVMAEEFPRYKEHTLLDAKLDVRKYAYVSSARPEKLKEWLGILLEDMAFKVDKDATVAIKGREIVLKKVVPVPHRPSSAEKK